MKSLRKKLLAFSLVFILLLSVIPSTIFSSAESVIVSTEQELREAIDAIPKGEQGEITIQNTYMYLTEGLYFEEKDITFNLIDASIVTASFEGFGQPVIFGWGTNITINANSNSSIESMGHTGKMGIIHVDNSTDWNEQTQSFEKDFTITVNGGRYTCTQEIPEDHEEDCVFAAVSGVNVVLNDVICNGSVYERAEESIGITVPGNLTINSGKFTNDITEYAASDKYSGSFGDNYYVRDKEMTDDFKLPLTNGKLVFNQVKPSAEDEALWLLSESFYNEYPDFYLDPCYFNEDFSKLDLGLYFESSKEEWHSVDVVWNYDPAVLEMAQSFIENFPEDRPWFSVSDLELVNYWLYSNPDSLVDSLANYSGELKSILDNANFSFEVETRGGGGSPFYSEAIGSAKLIHNGIVYFSSGFLGARAEHAIHVPEDTADTKEALILAAQKRIDDYIGSGLVTITASQSTLSDFYNSEISYYDERLATAQAELDEARALLEAEQAKDSSLWDWDLITQCNFKIMDCESELQYVPTYKQDFIDSFAEGGDFHFLNYSAGDFFFNVNVEGREETFTFIIVKDDEKLDVPSYKTTDLNTQVSVKSNSSTIPLDTLITVEGYGDKEQEEILLALGVAEGKTYDIKLHSSSLDSYFTQLESGKFLVNIPVPTELEGKSLTVYYLDDNGNITEHPTTVTDGIASFETDHFSAYTLAVTSSVINGDINSDGMVDICDLVAIDRAYRGMDEESAACDINNDQIFDEKDIIALRQILM